ncbi:SMC family ATPase [Hoyosella sp. G463]|uniref:Nuclease SbcCD subunit C n=1 Tax=Lolliginicoccus lacisalsi TaxID=2742202 RepID=A0A927JBK2_9ACTN|nr:SMC family ATPase [Lolliginicoccus lacisalsi]MBD8506246.1 SMC family ATPase [Lolliginicoccus lacisalsi]
MRLHTLTIEAFGPFAGTERVDFDEIGADGLFLLHGQTGAGKTTILDAVAFALFGAAPGARGSGHKFLSHHAPPDATPRVTLDATIKGRRLRLIRSPEHQRPKRRGAGFTTQNARASLEWLSPDGSTGTGEHLTRIDEIGRAVSDLLGMSKDQFFQVVLLPQGEFAEFLRAPIEDREKLLESLFATYRFGTVENWFRDRRRESEQRMRDALHQRELRISAIGTAADLAADEHPVPGSNDDVRAWMDTVAAVVTARAQDAEQARAGAAAAFASADEARTLARENAQRRASLAAARQQIEALELESGRITALAAELGAAQRASAVASPNDRLGELRTRLAAARTAMHQHAQVLQEVPSSSAIESLLEHGQHARARGLLDEAIGQWNAEVGALRGLIRYATERDDAAARMSKISTRIQAAQARRDDLAARIEGMPAEREQLDAALAEAAETARAEESLRNELALLVDRRDAAGKLPSAVARFEDARAAHNTAHARHLDARDLLQRLREQRISGMASALARQLRDGEPCMVCGSIDHPAPTAPGRDTISEDEENEAARAETEALADRDARHEELRAAEHEVERLRERTGDAEPGELDRWHTEAAARHEQAQQAVGMLEQLRLRRTELDATEGALREDLATTRTALAALEEQHVSLHQRAQELTVILDEARGSDADIPSRTARLEELVDTAAGLRDAMMSVHDLESRVSEQASECEQAARDAGFGTVDAAIAALRAPAWHQETEADLRQHRDRGIQARAMLDEPLNQAAEQAPCDVAAAEEAFALAQDASDQASEDLARARHARDRTASSIAALTALLDEHADQHDKHQQLIRLTEVITGTGENTRTMSLRSYVLAARLEEVAEAASQRLRIMTAGRYEFQHSDSSGRHGKRGGLGLDIRDDYTGTLRPVNSLSGGETFMASLSLALGLADVVAAESGGAILDTLFIDEGFGTLDADTLDAVMSVLDELRAGGRVVGIVSHVDEMRQRIPSRIHVRKHRDGSSIRSTAPSSSPPPS